MTSNYTAEQAVTVKIPVVLTIKDAMQKIKQDCPDTAISEHFLRQLVRDGVLPALKAGNKALINMDVLSEYLSNPEAEKFQPKGSAHNGNAIRPVPLGR